MDRLESMLTQIVYDTPPRVHAVLEKPAPGVHVLVDEALMRPGTGFDGNHDRVSWWKGRPVEGREVTAMASEVLDVLNSRAVIPGDNLITRGLDLRVLRDGDRIRAGEVVLERTASIHKPCALFAARISEEARRAVLATQTRGALFVVREGGFVRTGDPITRL